MRGSASPWSGSRAADFPSFSEGLSLRGSQRQALARLCRTFPFLFGGTFIEGESSTDSRGAERLDFPSFSEGLSLRDQFPGYP